MLTSKYQDPKKSEQKEKKLVELCREIQYSRKFSELQQCLPMDIFNKIYLMKKWK